MPDTNRKPVACRIIGSDHCEVDGLVVKHNAPVFAMCRKLIDAGYDPELPLEAYRGEMLCLRVSSLRYGAKFTVNDNRRGTPVLRLLRGGARGCNSPAHASKRQGRCPH
jgi:hypothetical protein